MRPHYPPAPGDPPDDRQRYPAANTMNPALGKRYEGLDVNGNFVSGVVLHVGNYDKQRRPTTYMIRQDDCTFALIPADALQAHLDGLALCESMERDRE
jgi:hypothetical protein